MTFSLLDENKNVYVYTYKITELTEDTFTGSYSYTANGVACPGDELVSGVRLK